MSTILAIYTVVYQTIFRWHIYSAIFVPKITGIGQPLLKLSLVVGWCPFLRHSVIRTKATPIPPCVEVWQTSNLRRLRLGEEKKEPQGNNLIVCPIP